MAKPLSLSVPEIQIQWISKKYGNFICDKIYPAKAFARGITKPYTYTSFRITDEDDDLYTLDAKDKNSKYIIV